MTRFPTRILVAVLLSSAVLATGCGGDTDDAAPGSTTPAPIATDSESGDDGAEQGDEVVRAPADLDLPRSVIYAGVELELTGAEWSNATPPTFDRPEPSVGPQTLLFLELSTAFLPDYPGDDGFMPVRHFVIETADGERRPATGVDYLAEVPVLANAESSVTLAFEVTEDELDGAVLTYDDATRVAAHLPLTGPVPAPAYPVRVEMNGVAVPHLATGCEPTPTEVQLVAVEWDIDGGVGEDGTKLARGQSSRVPVDHRWLRAEIEVTAGTGQCGGTFANQETFRLLVDGQARSPLNTYSLTLADGQVAPMIFLFEVPVDATEVVLDAGARQAATAGFAIEVPNLP